MMKPSSLAESAARKTFARRLRRCRGAAFLLLALGVPILMAIPPAAAQEAGAAKPAPRARRYRRASIDDRVKRLAKSLDLSEAQQSEVKKILEQRQQQMLRIRLNPSISGSTRIDQFRALQDKTVERIRAVLNDEQKKKYDPLASRKLQAKPERSVEDWLKATTPPQ
jgi:hypothetical protein